MYMCVRVHAKKPAGRTLGDLLYVLETGCLTELGTRLSPASDSPVSDLHSNGDIQVQMQPHPALYVDAGNLNSGPHAVMLRIFTPELSF